MRFTGLDRLYSLVTLDLSENRLTDVGSVITLGELPCLEILDLQGNGLVKAPMYRVRIFTAFEDRAEQVKPDQPDVHFLVLTVQPFVATTSH